MIKDHIFPLALGQAYFVIQTNTTFHLNKYSPYDNGEVARKDGGWTRMDSGS